MNENLLIPEENRNNLQTSQANLTLVKIAGAVAKLGGWSIDVESGKVLWSDVVAAIHAMPIGFSPTLDEGINYYAPEYREKIVEKITLCYKQGYPFDEEMEIINAYGKRVFVRVIGEAIRDMSGKIVTVQGAFQDISDSKKAEKERDKLLQIIDKSFDEVYIFAADSLRFEYLNQSALNNLGYTLDEILSLTPVDIKPDYTLATFNSVIQPLRDGRKDLLVFETRHRRKNGTHYDVEVHLQLYVDRKKESFFAIINDITERKLAIIAMQDSQRNYKIIADNTYDWEFWQAPDEHFIYHSPSCERFTGYKAEDFINNQELFFSLIHPDDRDSYLRHLRGMNRIKQPGSIEFRIQLNDGVEKWIGQVCQPVFDESGNYFGLRGNNRDITRRIHHEAIIQSRFYLTRFAMTHSLDELLEETLNEAEKISGSLIGFYHFVHDDQQTLTLQNWSTRTKQFFCKAEGKGAHYSVSMAGVWVDCIYQRKPVIHNDYASLPHKKGMPEGHAAVIRELVVPVFRNDKITAILGVGNKPTDYTKKDIDTVSMIADMAWEIAERKIGEEALKKSEEKFRTLFQCLSQGVFYQRADGKLIDVNPAALEIFGLTYEEFTERTSYSPEWKIVDENLETVPSEEHPSMLSLLTGEVVSKVLGVYNYRSQELRWLMIVATPQFLSGELFPFQTFVTLQEITDRFKAEQLLRESEASLKILNATKDKFFSIIAHDLRNPYQNLLAISKIFTDEVEDLSKEEISEFARRLYEIVMNQFKQLENLLTWSRVQRNSIGFNPEKVDVFVKVQSIFSSLHETANAKNITLMTQLQSGYIIKADNNMLQSILINLISNSLKFTKSGGSIMVAADTVEGVATVTVKDTGVGMGEEVLNRIFDFSAKISTLGTEKEPGTGLGLALCKEFVEKHGGNIWVESTEGVGSTFTFTIPQG